MRGVALAFVTISFLGCACSPCSATPRHATASLAEVLDDGTYLQLQEFTGASKWAALQHIFTSATVRVDCPGHQDFHVYTGRTLDDLRSLHGRKDRAWCGWDRFAGRSPEVCVAPVSPFGSTVVAVAQPKSWFAAGPSSCRMTRQEEFSMPRFLAALAGAFLFWWAPALSESTPFRLTGGTVGFVALSLVLALFVLYRSVPHKRSLVIGTALFGGTLAAAVRWAFGTWLPSVPQLARNPAVAAYLLLSGLLGLALSYYYNDTSNQKVNTMLRVALQLVGLALVGGSASLPEGSAAAVAALLAAKVAATAAPEMPLRRVKAHVAGGAPEQVREAPPEEAPATQPSSLPAPTTPGAATAAAQQVSPLVLRGLILNEETGKIIQIGKGVYNRLVVAGHVVDTSAGTITPPPEAAANAERGSGGRRRSGSPQQRRKRG